MTKPNTLPHVYNWSELKTWLEIWKPQVAKELEIVLSNNDPVIGQLLCIDSSVYYWQNLSPSTSDFLSDELAKIFYVVWQ